MDQRLSKKKIGIQAQENIKPISRGVPSAQISISEKAQDSDKIKFKLN